MQKLIFIYYSIINLLFLYGYEKGDLHFSHYILLRNTYSQPERSWSSPRIPPLIIFIITYFRVPPIPFGQIAWLFAISANFLPSAFRDALTYEPLEISHTRHEKLREGIRKGKGGGIQEAKRYRAKTHGIERARRTREEIYSDIYIYIYIHEYTQGYIDIYTGIGRI